jgi:Tfp pilus assembly protein PilF
MRLRLAPLFLLCTSALLAQGISSRPTRNPHIQESIGDLAPLPPFNPSSSPAAAPPANTGIISVSELNIPSLAARELERARRAFDSGDCRSTATHLEKALRIYSDILSARNNLGVCYLQLREYEKAAAEFQSATQLDPRAPAPFINLGIAFTQLLRLPEAEAATRHALSLDPTSSRARFVLGTILLSQHHSPEEAIDLFHRSAMDFPRARTLLARLFIQQGAVEDAAAELRLYLAAPNVPDRSRVQCWLIQLTNATPSSLPTLTSAPASCSL